MTRRPGPISLAGGPACEATIGPPTAGFQRPGPVTAIEGSFPGAALEAGREEFVDLSRGATADDVGLEDEFEPTAMAARWAFIPVYEEMLQAGRPEWQPRGRDRGIWPDRATYPSVEIRPNGDVFGTYRELKRYLQGCRLTGRRQKRQRGEVVVTNQSLEAHHLLEDRLLKPFGVPRDEGLCVALEWNDHSEFSADLPWHLPRGVFYDIHDVFEAHADMYRSHRHSEWIAEIRKFLSQAAIRDAIRRYYNSGVAPGAKEAGFAERRQKALDFLDQL